MAYLYKDVDITTYLSEFGTVNNLTQSAYGNASQSYQGIDPTYVTGSNLSIERMYNTNVNSIGYTINTNTSLSNYLIPSYNDYSASTSVTPPSWATHCSIICIGAGGGGAGGTQGFQKTSNQSKNSQDGSGGGGGGSGGIVYISRTPATSSIQVNIGGGGAGGNMDQVGGAGQPSIVTIQGGSSITANGGGGGGLGSSNGGSGGVGGGPGNFSGSTNGLSGITGQTGNSTGNDSRTQSQSINNSFYTNSVLPEVSVWGFGGAGGGAGNSNEANPNTSGLAGSNGFVRIYWLNSNL